MSHKLRLESHSGVLGVNDSTWSRCFITEAPLVSANLCGMCARRRGSAEAREERYRWGWRVLGEP